MKKISKIYLVLVWTFFILKLTTVIYPESEYQVEGIADKFIHFFLFGIFSFLILNLFKKKNILFLLFSMVLGVFFSCFIECVQEFITGRNSSLYDLLAGSAGSIIFVLVYYYLINIKPKLLLHICCVGCGAFVSGELKKDYRVSLYFYNPNIFPKEEYLVRLKEAEKVVKKLKIKLYKGNYNYKLWLKAVKGYENNLEKGDRCTICYEERLRSTAIFAKLNNFKFFTSTLTVSPHKDAKRIIDLGEKLEEMYKVGFLGKDFKKKDGFKKASILSKKLKLYRQNYCGCEFSKRK